MIGELARHILESTVLAAAVSLLPLLMTKRSAAARHSVWLIAASKFAVPAALFRAIGSEIRTLVHAPFVQVNVSPAFSRLVFSSGTPVLGARTTGGTWALLEVVWLGGATVMFAFWLRKLHAAFDVAAPVLDSEKESLLRIQEQTGLGRAIRLRASQSRMEPGLAGILHPTITIPQGLSARLTSGEFDAVLFHELAHAKRMDNFTGAFVHALVCIFWFHPLLWWIEWKLAKERELACDEMVVRYSGSPEEYAAGILKVCRFHLGEAPAGACGISGLDLKRRVEVIMSFRLQMPDSRSPRTLVGVLVSVMTILPLAGGFLGRPAVYAQTSTNPKPASGAIQSKDSVGCVFSDKVFAEGQVIKEEGTDHQQMCAHYNGRPVWVHTSDAARERSREVITVPRTPDVYCQPKPSPSVKLCACQNGIFSIGSIVYSANGPLRCDKGKWRPATPAEMRHQN